MVGDGNIFRVGTFRAVRKGLEYIPTQCNCCARHYAAIPDCGSGAVGRIAEFDSAVAGGVERARLGIVRLDLFPIAGDARHTSDVGCGLNLDKTFLVADGSGCGGRKFDRRREPTVGYQNVITCGTALVGCNNDFDFLSLGSNVVESGRKRSIFDGMLVAALFKCVCGGGGVVHKPFNLRHRGNVEAQTGLSLWRVFVAADIYVGVVFVFAALIGVDGILVGFHYHLFGRLAVILGRAGGLEPLDGPFVLVLAVDEVGRGGLVRIDGAGQRGGVGDAGGMLHDRPLAHYVGAGGFLGIERDGAVAG